MTFIFLTFAISLHSTQNCWSMYNCCFSPTSNCDIKARSSTKNNNHMCKYAKWRAPKLVRVPQIGKSTNGVWETSELGGTQLILLLPIGVFTWFDCEVVTTQDIWIVPVPQTGKSTNGVRETSKLGENALILLLPIGVFTWFHCGLITTQDISIVQVPQIGESTNGVRETSKLGGTTLIWLFQVGVFTWFNCALVTTQDISIVRMPQIGESTDGVRKNSKGWWNWNYVIIPSWGVYLMWLRTCPNSRHFNCSYATN
jgi:hypothetical protein